MSEKLNKGFDFPIDQIEEMIGAKINTSLGSDFNRIVPLRAIQSVKGVVLFESDTFEKLIKGIPLRSQSEKIYPYADAKINVFRRQPEGFDIGQTFINSKKLLALMQDLESRLLGGFYTGGLSKMPPTKIYGIDSEERKVIAFYIPPIAEVYNDGKNGSSVVLIDGIHRSYICKAAGTTVNAVHINYISPDSPLPFDPITWRDAKLMEDKPPIDQRYKNLRREYFRDLNSIGIDG